MDETSAQRVRERLEWEGAPELYHKIRRLWIRHSIAEDRRNIDALLATLAEDCAYQLVSTGQRWEGHAGARAFYEELFAAFPDLRFDLTDIVIGPQGVFEAVVVTGTFQQSWAGRQPTGKPMHGRLQIHFPWDPTAEKFGGETIFLDASTLENVDESGQD